jgi:hypothetical protein
MPTHDSAQGLAAGTQTAAERRNSKRNLPVTRSVWKAHDALGTFLVIALAIVHCLGPQSPVQAQNANPKGKAGAAKAATPLQVHYGTDKLPMPVVEMRDAILSAARSGKIEDLRYAFELNELKPEIAPGTPGDPVKYWKSISGDGEGREILAALAEILEGGYVALPAGRDIENNRIYVWPYHAEIPLARLDGAQEVELLRLVPPQRVREMKAIGKYTYWRLAIGADGTWHSFLKPQ